MDRGYGDMLARSAGAWLFTALLVAFLIGAGTVKGCDYLVSHYTVTVEKKP